MSKKLPFTLAVLSSTVLVGSFFIHPREIYCENIRCDSETDIYKKVMNNSIFRSRTIVQSDLSSLPQVKNVDGKIDFGGNLFVSVEVKKPSISLKLPDGSFLFFTDAGEYIGSESNDQVQTVNVYNRFDSKKSAFIAVLSYQLLNLLSVKDSYVRDDSLYFQTKDDVLAIFPLDGDIDLLLGEAVASFSQLNGNSEKFNIVDEAGKTHKASQVDFRFGKPIIR